jgi:hypothetical protein
MEETSKSLLRRALAQSQTAGIVPQNRGFDIRRGVDARPGAGMGVTNPKVMEPDGRGLAQSLAKRLELANSSRLR